MRLSDFILAHSDAILRDWDTFSRKSEPAAPDIAAPALRKRAAQMLVAIAADMATLETPEHAFDIPHARGSVANDSSPASIHGEARLTSGFTIQQLLADYRALRASVLRLWLSDGQVRQPADLADMIRFDEAIDRAQAESVARYASMVNQSQDMFLAILGHELRNPLNTTIMAASFLRRTPGLLPSHIEVVDRIHRSGMRMGRLISDLVDYTRTNLGSTLPITVARANMGAICRAAVDEMRQAHPERAIQLESGTDLDGVWDEGRVAQVLSNLLGNALQHGDKHEPVSMKVESSAGKVHVRIHNKGSPIAPAALSTIFDPMVRLTETPSGGATPNTSMGLGLHVALLIARAHGGELFASSDARHGTTFSLRLPRIPPLQAATATR